MRRLRKHEVPKGTEHGDGRIDRTFGFVSEA
jgi:hypothetical protein